MRAEIDLTEIERIMTAQEDAVRSSGVNTALLGTRELGEDTSYRVYPFRGDPFLVTKSEFGGLLLGRFGSRLNGRDRHILDRVVRDLDEGPLGSGFQHFPLQGTDQVLQCLVDREGLAGDPPSVTWSITSVDMIDYFESVARPAGRILIDG